MSLFLSRARLRTDTPAAALRQVLMPEGDAARIATAHRVVWTLFSDSPDRARDFLWREEAPGRYLLLSRRVPTDPHHLFELDEPKSFEPALDVGDRLRFQLRANATVSPSRGREERGKPQDVVMHALHGLSKASRAAERADVVSRAGLAWLERVGERAGFGFSSSSDCTVAAHRVLALPREAGRPVARMGILDFEGELEVRDPVRFIEALANGFGRGKAFGNGLMLIRRA
jgi:CRISPR system Cascade subunit CasE